MGGIYAVPHWVGSDGQLLALSRHANDTSALFAVDAKTRQIELISLSGYDFTGSMVYDPQARRLLGVHYETDGYGTAWLEPQMRATQAAVDVLLPATINRINCQRRGAGHPRLRVRHCKPTLAFFVPA